MSENQKGYLNSNYKHGGKGTRLYNIWKDIKKRCNNEKSISYKWYGGKGVKRCVEWDDFSVFKDWSDSNGYFDNLTIDRIDNDKDYCPDNCRWVTQEFQKSNTKTNRYLIYNGIKYHAALFARTFNISNSKVIYLSNKGMTPEQIISNGKIRNS